MKVRKVQVFVNDVKYDAVVGYRFYKGEPSVTHLEPENCSEGSNNEYELIHLTVIYKDEHCVAPYLLETESEFIIEQLEDFYSEEDM